jgi:MFS family permease
VAPRDRITKNLTMAATSTGTPSAAAALSPWAPLRIKAYRTLWLAQIVSNIGTWMQTVGAQWMLVHRPNAATLTSLAQAASLIPVFFVSLPAGVLADVLDRRRLLIATSLSMCVLAGTLTALTAAGLTTPAVLLVLTFLMGCGQALTSPAWQAIQPELVPRAQIPAAAALGSMNINVARAIGPALAGLLVAATSPAVVFGVNAVSFLAVTAAVFSWRRPVVENGDPERWSTALLSGTRYVRHAPGIRRILLRSALFVVPGSALWALLTVVAGHRLGLGAGGYGLLLGALGTGAVLGAFSIKRLRDRFSDNRLLVLGALAFSVGTFTAATVTVPVVVGLALVVAGTGWLVNLSTLNTVLQLTLSGWVRARGMAAYMVVFLGGQGLGAIAWGLVAQAFGVPEALGVATVLLLLCAASVKVWPLLPGSGTFSRDISIVPEPELVLEPDPDDGPVIVEVVYTVPPEHVTRFLAAMRPVGRFRRRTGAVKWGVFRDAGTPDQYAEVFQVPSWAEHLRQHNGRTTEYDAGLMAAVKDFATGPPRVRHLIPATDMLASEPSAPSATAPVADVTTGENPGPR